MSTKGDKSHSADLEADKKIHCTRSETKSSFFDVKSNDHIRLPSEFHA